MPQVVCRICSKMFYIKPSHQKLGWGKYCSVNCRSKSQIRGQEVLCDVCGKKIHRTPKQIRNSKSGLFFCSKKCQTLWRNRYFSGERHANWISGASAYRKILQRTKVKQACKLCGNKNKLVLSVHHLDHNRQNNTSPNLIWLCFNCHFLVHHDPNVEKSLQNRRNLG